MNETPRASDKHLSPLSALLYRLPWFSRRRQGSLVVHLMALAFCWGVLVYLIAIVGLWWTADRLIKDNMHRQALQWLGKLDELGTPLLVSGSTAQFELIREHVANFPEVAFLRYLAPDGTTELARYDAPGGDPQLFPEIGVAELRAIPHAADGGRPHLRRESADVTLVRISGPTIIKSIRNDGLIDVSLESGIKEDAKVIGFVDLGLDFRIYRENLGRHILLGSCLILAFFFLATLLGRYIILRALRPLADLQIPLARLAEGDTDIIVESRGATEIAAIGQALSTTISAIKERDRELRRLAVYDTLTGLFNRHNFTHALQRERARVQLEHSSSALLFIDLDRFKEVNDAVGHTAGDELLIQVAQRLKATVRASDTVSRLGGDEFTIILHGAGEEEAVQVADKICTSLREFVFTAEGQSFRVQCSIGITLIDARETTDNTLLSQADTACQEAKKLGRDGYKLFREIAPLAPLAWSGSGLREQLERALANDGFRLEYLPVIAAGSDRVIASQGALRMRCGEEDLPAGAFQFAAERFDLIQAIDRQAISMALHYLASRPDNHQLGLALSGRSVQQTDLLPFLRNELEQSGVAPGRLVFALTERTVLESATQTKIFMNGIRDLGCGIAIDDFGVSLNSIPLLQELPVDQLWLEGNLVNSIGASPFNRILVASIVHLASEIGLRTVAKQVVDGDVALLLCECGVDALEARYLQG